METIIFTDGASRGNPGPGGWAAVLIFSEKNQNGGLIHDSQFKIYELGGRENHTTNNRMELQAAISALSFLSSSPYPLNPIPYTLIIFSDSSYLINGITKWIFGWQKKNWITAQKTPVENQDLWKKLIEVSDGKNIEWKYVGGHSGAAGNERCDEIATDFADLSTGSRQAAPKLFSGALEDYPIKNILSFEANLEKVADKKSKSARAGAKAHSYLSMIGGRIETHKTWAECEKRVKGKAGAKFRKALSAEEEKEIISEWDKKAA